MSELWDLYDKDRKPLNKTHLRGEKMPEGSYHVVVHVCIFNSKGELLIQQRQPFKKGWSNMWDLSVGGSAVTGDSSRQAAEREIKEELGLDIDLSSEMPRMTINFEKGFDDYWMTTLDVEIDDLKLQYEEVKDARWVNKEELMKMVNEGVFINYFFIDKIFDIYKRLGAIHD